MNDSSPAAAPGEAPYLDVEPPAWAARSLATVLISLFAVLAIAALAVHVPETISAQFVIVPVRGTDPVRAFRDGIVTEARVRDTQTVRAGETLFVITSPAIGDRAAESAGLQAQLAGAGERSGNVRTRYENEQRARDEEESRLRIRLASLEKTIQMNTQQLSIAAELAERQKKAFDEGISSWSDLARVRLEINRLQIEAQQAQAERDEIRRAVAKSAHENLARQSEFRESERSAAEDLGKARVRTTMLEKELAQTGNQLTAAAPCAGSVVKTNIRGVGAVVREGDVLAEVACRGERLEAELTIPQDGMALLRPGQDVKLLYDAFPYQRYGVRLARVRWVSPAGTGEPGKASFRALADLKETDVPVRGQRRPVESGMGGRARIIVGRRSLVSYVFEPLRQLKESLAPVPSK
ncbi:MAG: HlyD family efflux transporter periplasmic adaptor subunit [Acidobacteriota bacterium]